MTEKQRSNDRKNSRASRREFLRGSAAAIVGASSLGLGSAARGENIDTIRIGLVGCGGRGTGAVMNALQADPNVHLVAVGDTFEDRILQSLNRLRRRPNSDRVKVDREHSFVGFDAYKQVIDACDVVLFATPPHFRPAQIEAAVAEGKHIFAEKPIAVDAPGVRAVMDSCRRAKEKNLTIVSGLCYRYQDAKLETLKRIHDGAVGEIRALQCTYNTGGLWNHGRKPEWSDMEWQVRNWLYFNWLSGDHINEQSIHSIDKMMWAMNDLPPLRCTANGGRIVRTDAKWGNIFDHFNATYEWEGGVKLFHSCRQWEGADGDVSDFVFGTKGIAAVQGHRIEGENAWNFEGKPEDMYVSEMKSLFGAVRSGETINNGEYMCVSTMAAIMGRMAAYTGKTVTWEQALQSENDMSPPAYEWSDLPVAAIAQPGKTALV